MPYSFIEFFVGIKRMMVGKEDYEVWVSKRLYLMVVCLENVCAQPRKGMKIVVTDLV